MENFTFFYNYIELKMKVSSLTEQNNNWSFDDWVIFGYNHLVYH